MFKNKDKNIFFLEKQVEPLFKSTLSGGIGNIFIAFLVYLSLKATSHDNSILYFFIAITFFSSVRIIASLSYLKYKKNILILPKRSCHTYIYHRYILGVNNLLTSTYRK